MVVLFAGTLPVRYGYFHLFPRGARRPTGFVRTGQANGLCAASNVHGLSFLTGLHTGPIPLALEWHTAEPPPAPDWEDVVEVSFAMPALALAVASFDEEVAVDLPATGVLRVRYCAAGLDAARDQEIRGAQDPIVDDYLVQLWQAPPGPDAIVRQRSRWAAGLHAASRPAVRADVLPVEEILVVPGLLAGPPAR